MSSVVVALAAAAAPAAAAIGAVGAIDAVGAIGAVGAVGWLGEVGLGWVGLGWVGLCCAASPVCCSLHVRILGSLRLVLWLSALVALLPYCAR